MDTARAENFSCYGYHRPTSPNIDAFAQEATFYANSMASSPWTIPSHASFFTGKDPFEHGAHRLDPRKYKRLRLEFTNPLHEKHTTLAEAFAAKGFATGGFIANDAYINSHFKMDQGFQTFYCKHTTSDSINTMAYEWLDSLSTDRFFLFINYMDTHVPFNAKPRPGFLEKPAPFDDGELMKKLVGIYRNPPKEWEENSVKELQQNVIDQYDTAIANLDEQIGDLLDYLKEKRLYDRSVIVLTSDHGEMFGEHDLVSHGHDVYHPLLWVPLIVKTPDQAKSLRVETVISSSDIPYLIFSQFPGKMKRSFMKEFPNAPGNHPAIAENYYAHPRLIAWDRSLKNFNRIRTVLFDWPYKYIRSSDDDHELYNIAHDRRETGNLLMIKPELATKFDDQLTDFLNSRPHFDEIIPYEQFTEKELKQLKALGYIGD
jgi:arylsulfatase A-like enzyme